MRMHRLYLATVFTTGASVMVIELVGSRIVAPVLGTSLFVWTSLIGVILAALSLGYWWGGRLADKDPSISMLARIIFVGACLTLLSFFLIAFLPLIALVSDDLRIQAIIAAVFLFAPATVALAMVSPYTIRLSLKEVTHSGAAIGVFSAVGTMGSIVGTFLGGFFLISYFGSARILLLVSLVLFFLAILLSRESRKLLLLSIIFFLLAGVLCIANEAPFKPAHVLADVESPYARTWVYEDLEFSFGPRIRYLANSTRGVQSGMYVNNPYALVLEYSKMYDLAFRDDLRPRKTLMIGAGAYTYPKHFLHTYPSSTIDVVEIDPQVTMLARKFFALVDDPRLHIFHEDGRVFITTQAKKVTYDAIFIDAFHTYLNVPFQLTTREAIQKYSNLLSPDGFILVNFISAFSGENALLFDAMRKTYMEQFPYVYVFQVRNEPSWNVQNVFLIAAKTEQMFPEIYEKKLWTEPVSKRGIVLTDDFAPVERYVASFVNEF